MTVTLFWAVYFGVTFAVWFLFNRTDWNPAPWSYFDRTPFQCSKCLQTWVLVASYISIAYIIASPAFGFWGVILAAGNAAALQYDEKQRIEYEDKQG